ncbi:MAG: EamA family transporter [Syntrophomonadaceae bacterium]|nr:EamA family transporter [Syntrophomonadaceae bacterium]
MNPYYIGVVLVLISAASFGVMPIFAIYAYQGQATVTTVLFLRFALATIMFFSYIAVKVKNLAITRSCLWSLILMGGVLYTLQSNLYFFAVKHIPASLVALLFYAYPVFVAVLASVVDKERPTQNTLTAILMALTGLTMVLGTSLAGLNVLGALLALGAAAVYSIYIVLGNRLVKDIPPVITSAFVSLFASFSLLLVGLMSRQLVFDFAGYAWWPILGIVVFSTVIAIFTFFRGLELLGSTRAAILSMIEPLVTIVFSTVLFHDRLTALQWAGGLLVLTGAFLAVTNQKQPAHELGRLRG